jgi:hypothetical protein
MKHPQIVIFESDGLLARLLTPVAVECRWLLRESRQLPACLNLLREGGPSLLVLKLGRNLIRELSLLDRARALLPDVPAIVVADTVDAGLITVVYDLGALYVLLPPEPRQNLVPLATQALRATIVRFTEALPRAARGAETDA